MMPIRFNTKTINNMAKTRAKKQVTEVITKPEAVIEMQKYAEATSKKKQLEAKIEMKIQAIREEHASDLMTCVTEQNEAFTKLQAFAEFRKDELFVNKKSLDLSHGVIGMRIGTPKVKAIGITLGKALEMVKMAGLKKFIRTKVELDKEEIIQCRDDAKQMEALNTIGLHVVQDETFYVEPKEEDQQ